MATLSSASTDAQVWAAFDDNASYEEDDSRAKALAFSTACRILLRRRPTRSSRDGLEVEFDDRTIQGELSQVRQWLTANPATTPTRARYADLEGFRD